MFVELYQIASEYYSNSTPYKHVLNDEHFGNLDNLDNLENIYRM